MAIVRVHQTKTNLSRLIKMAVAWIIAIGQVKKRQPGSLKGKLRVGPDRALACKRVPGQGIELCFLPLVREPDAKIRAAAASDPQVS